MPNITTASGASILVTNKGLAVTPDPDPRTCSYVHFNLSTEQLGSTGRYNCWGFTFLPRRYWILKSTDVDQILADKCVPASDGALRPGDVIRYRKFDAQLQTNVTTHTFDSRQP